ncbi:DUF6148 family protein [Selenomonas sputigena]|uniref:DUF6148 family protein n=1 Tax=Selenomonas sputigena TaxID=69823 RepID=UPI00222FDEFF|nr:DUF6148 family protein [Selenomonas sputigena]UZD44251.1 DUF6148 family protein [Selenomonas sputigena]
MAKSETVVRERLELYYEAERKVLRGQSYTLGNRQLTRANLAEIHRVIKELEGELMQMAGRSRGFSKRVVFYD